MEQEKLRLAAIRKQINLSPVEMAKEMGITLDRYYRIESGESKLLATEFCAIHAISGFDYERISPVQ